MTQFASRTSAQEAVDRFDTPEAAAKYARSLGGSATHRREIGCILRALADLSCGASVLDLPCGTGRLLPELAARGFAVIEADSSAHMVERARKFARESGVAMDDNSFVVANVLNTPFADLQFDAVVCNRLFHHFREPEVRQSALRELGRICRGPIVASFFCNLAFDAAMFHLKQSIRRDKATDRIPIGRGVFAGDARAAGLRIIRWLPTRPGISKQWYAVMRSS